jgi:hypothetical protein
LCYFFMNFFGCNENNDDDGDGGVGSSGIDGI